MKFIGIGTDKRHTDTVVVLGHIGDLGVYTVTDAMLILSLIHI